MFFYHLFRIKSIALLSLILSLTLLGKQLPIVLVHGIMANTSDMSSTKKYIKKYLPEAKVKNIEIAHGISTSWWNIFDQCKWLAEKIQEDNDLQDGFIIIGHSQGGLLARYYVEHYNKPRVHTYISWGTPQFGLFGFPGTFDDRFSWLDSMESTVHSILYSSLMQNTISFAGFWRDTMHFNDYLEKCKFLPYLNNEKKHALASSYRDNICSLVNMVLVQSIKDDIIEPRESCHFGFYCIGSKEKIEPLRESSWYKKDALGLKTLYENGRLHLLFADCAHTDFPENENNFVYNTLPFLRT